MESVDQVASRKFCVSEGEGTFFETLLRREEFAGAAGGIDQFVGFGEVGDVEAAKGKSKLRGIVEGEFTGSLV